MKGYYFITDAKLSRTGNLSDVKNALVAGVDFIQYRDKSASSRNLYAEAMKLRKICRNKAKFIINDRLDIALAVNADGLHLGQADLPYKIARKLFGKNKIIGLTVHNLKEAKEAQRMGADYLAVAPIFSTSTKPDAGKPVGIGLLKKIKKNVSLPVVAIGGINLSNAGQVVKTGVDSLCAISAVVVKKDVKKEINKFQKLFGMV